MSQYGTGTVKVLGADHNRWVLLGGVTSNGAIDVGDQVKFDSEPHLWFTVSSIIDALTFDTVEDYSGTRVFDTYFPYVVTRDFTPNLALPEMTQGDRNTADIYTRMVRKLDGVLGTQLVKLTNATGGVLTTGDVVTLATTSDKAVSLVTVSGSYQKLLVCLDATIAAGGQGLFLTEGVAQAKVTGSIVRGNYVRSSATSKTVENTGTTVTAVATPPAGAVGVALTAHSSGYATIELFSATVVAAAGGGSGIPATIVDAKGDLIAATAADTVARVPGPSVDGQVLMANSAAATGMGWASAPGGSGIPATIVDAKGDLIAATGADTVARLPVGVDGQLLMANSAAATGLGWAAPAASGGITLLNATGAPLAAGDVVTFDPGADKGVALIAGSAAPQKILVSLEAIANGASGLFATEGIVLAKASGAITRGHYVYAGAGSGAVSDYTATVVTYRQPPHGSAGIALTAASGGFVTMYLFPTPQMGPLRNALVANSTAIANTTTLTTFSKTLDLPISAADREGTVITIKAAGVMSTLSASPGSLTDFQIRLGGQILFGGALVTAFGTSWSGRGWMAWVDAVVRSTGVSGTLQPGPGAAIFGTVMHGGNTPVLRTLDLVGPLTADVRWQWSTADPANTTTLRTLTIAVEPASTTTL